MFSFRDWWNQFGDLRIGFYAVGHEIMERENEGSFVGQSNGLLTVRNAILNTNTSFMSLATEAAKLSACVDGIPNAA